MAGGKAKLKRIRLDIIQQQRYGHTDGQPVQQRLEPVKDAFKASHAVKTLWRHAHRAQHGEFSPPQSDIGGDRVEDVGDADQAEQGDKPLSVNNKSRLRKKVCVLC